MGNCKNIECDKQTEGKRVYCSMTCRNYYVNKYMRDYTKNGEGLSKKVRDVYVDNPKYCKRKECSEMLPYDKRDNEYCNNSCVASSTNHTKKGLSHKLSKEGLEGILKSNRERTGYLIGEYEANPNKCVHCTKVLPFNHRNRKFCTKDCMVEYKRKDMDAFLIYKADAKFNFALNDYPDKFNFKLIEEHGWYAPSNSNKPNISGVSRDHMLSIREGFENGVDPKLLGHPANCKLMIHGDNISKHKKSSIMRKN